uniref:transcription factor bHLH145-like n=1 Tax=Erigeron canadensis TaxID=72917 RepID=UPI001CB9905A|nr:transcription factor bHLH145-like [Erigeron canadensis]
MEKGFDSWFQDRQIDLQSPNPNLLNARISLGPQVTNPFSGNMVSPTRQEPGGWFYGLPRYRQGLLPVTNSVKEQLPVAGPIAAQGANGAQKKFLVFDQSGDQTTLIYSGGVGNAPARYQFPSLNNTKPQYGSHLVHANECIKENGRDDSRSDMREDTEELNALLYSDDDDEEDDNYNDVESEEASTGHSPSSVAGCHEVKERSRSGEQEEIVSFKAPTKRRKREHEYTMLDDLEDTASSGKSGINCSGNEVFDEESMYFLSGNKKLKKDKMKETINLIKNLIPGDKNGRNAIMVIDEAISYLKSLKVQAKALGLDSL